MNILEKRQHNDAVLKLLSDLKFDKQPIELKGSASLRSQRYYSDYDFFSFIGNPSVDAIDFQLNNILTHIEANPNYYPIELKYQLLDGQKIKHFPPLKIDKEELQKIHDKLDFIKLDLCIFDNSIFTEVSIIYKLDKIKTFTTEEYLKSLKNDIKELSKERKYYKVLKRMFNIDRVKGNKENMLKLTEFFNSDVGKLYQQKSNLEAINLMKKIYKNDNIVKQKIKVNLSKIRPTTLKHYNAFNDEVNQKAKEFLKL